MPVCFDPLTRHIPTRLPTQGFELLPMTLEVGDYVLAPTTAVERKSVPDLHASLASGRWGGGWRGGGGRPGVRAGREDVASCTCRWLAGHRPASYAAEGQGSQHSAMVLDIGPPCRRTANCANPLPATHLHNA